MVYVPEKRHDEMIEDLIAAAQRIKAEVGTEAFPIVFIAYVGIRYQVNLSALLNLPAHLL